MKKKNAVKENAKTIAIAILASFLVSIIFILSLGVNPLEAFRAMIMGALGRTYGIAEVIAKATPLIIIGLGVTIASHGGLSNLGGDGQFYIGSIASILVGIYLDNLPAILIWIIAMVVGIIAGGIWGLIAGTLKAKFNTSEVIITIMLNYVALYLVGFLVGGPLQAPGGIPQTKAISKEFQFAKLIEGTRVHMGIFFAIIGAFIVWWIFKKTLLGYRIQTVGASPKAAEYAGINIKRYWMLIMFISGAFAGLAGMVEIYGVHYRVLEGISSSFGFTALLIALLAKLNPLAVILGSLFISTLTVGANAMQISMSIPTSIVNVMQSLIIFFMLIIPDIKKSIKSKISIITTDKEE